MSRVARRWLDTQVVAGDFSAEFTGTARLTAANTASRFNPPNNTSLTVAFWVRPHQLTAATYYVYAGVVDGTAPGDGWFILRSGGNSKFEVGFSSGAGYSLCDGFVPTVDTWYMIVGSFANLTGDKTIDLRVYDATGSVNDTTNVAGAFVNAAATGDLYVGSGAAGVNPANARMDKLGIWFRSFSTGEMDTLWNSGEGLRGNQLAGAGLTGNLQFYWDLDEATGAASWPAFAGGATLAATGTVNQTARAGH